MPVINKNNIYSDSESEDGSSLQKSSVRKPITKPKSSATVTPAPKMSSQKNVRTSPKKPEARRNSRSKTPAKEHVQSADIDLSKKKKSIFSPERPDTPPPPKLTPMKNISAPKKTIIKPRTKASVTLKKASSTSEKSRTSSVSSSVSSGKFLELCIKPETKYLQLHFQMAHPIQITVESLKLNHQLGKLNPNQ